MSFTDRKDDRTDRDRAGRLLAVLWIITAALAMQFVASSPRLSSDLSSQRNAGPVSLPDSGMTDTALLHHAIRAFPLADLRMTGDRTDAKASPGNIGPFVLPAPVLVSGLHRQGTLVLAVRQDADAALSRPDLRVRGPPGQAA